MNKISDAFEIQHIIIVIQRQVILFLASVVVSACGAQNPPIVNTLEEDTINRAPSATVSSEPLPTLASPQRPPNVASVTPASIEQTQTAMPIFTLDIFSLTEISTQTGIAAVSTSIIPNTGQEQTFPNTAVPDKFQGFEIPVTGGEGAPAGIIPVTGFPPGVVTGKRAPNPSNLIAPRLVIPSLDIDIPIFEIEYRNGTWDVSWLWDQAGWLEGTTYPTGEGNSVLTAHVVTADGRNGPFAYLKLLTVNDYVFLINANFRYIYKVEKISYVEPSDLSVLSQDGDSWLTLITCDSYDEKTGEYLLRVIVRTNLVEVQEIK